MKIYIGARVKVRESGKLGQVIGVLPSNGQVHWMVMLDNSATDLHTTQELERVA